MHTIVYDGTFEGLLTAVFDVYEYRMESVLLFPEKQRQDSLFTETHNVQTNTEKADRVWKALRAKISPKAASQVYYAFLCEQKGMENKLLQYIQYMFKSKYTAENDFTNAAVSYVVETAKKVHREKHRMEAFVRFQKLKDGLYFAIVQPDFNVLPVIKDHFEKRYADQPWLIYDSSRKYGIYYDLNTTVTVELEFTESISNGSLRAEILDEHEPLYQQLWQNYFSSVNIAARKNMKLHIRHMPKRYWKYLPEKGIQ